MQFVDICMLLSLTKFASPLNSNKYNPFEGFVNKILFEWKMKSDELTHSR